MKFKLFIMALAAITMVSCGGGGNESTAEEAPKELILKANPTVIKGDLKGCYEVVDKNYKVKFAKKSYERDVVTVELKRTSQELPYDRKNVVVFPEADKSTAEFCGGFGIEILDANGDVIDKESANHTPYSWDEMTAALQLLEDETTTISFRFDDLSQAVSFRITSIVQPNNERKSSVDGLIDAAKEAAEMNDDIDTEEVEKALDATGKAMEAAGKMLDVLGGLN